MGDRSRRRVAAAAGTTLLVLAAAGAAGASDAPATDGAHHVPAGRGLTVHGAPARGHRTGGGGTVGAPVASGLNAPFGLAVGPAGRVYVAETGVATDPPGPGRVLEVRGGATRVVASGDPFVVDVDANGLGNLAYLYGGPASTLTRILPNGRTSTVDLAAYEAARNPDQVNTYGPYVDLSTLVSPECWAQVPAQLAEGTVPYAGVVDTDTFRMATLPDGSRAVADAAGNDVVRVAPDGSVSTLAVLPPIEGLLPPDVLAQVTDDDGNHLPACVLEDPDLASGIALRFEPVPTSVAVGPDGALYVGSLPGGELPGAGRVFRVDLHTHAVTAFVPDGFSGVTDIAFGKDGTLYVAELFADQVSAVPTSWSGGHLVAGDPRVLASVPQPNGLAVGRDGTVYASVGSLGPDGAVVPIRP